jgi:hypothetical protein
MPDLIMETIFISKFTVKAVKEPFGLQINSPEIYEQNKDVGNRSGGRFLSFDVSLLIKKKSGSDRALRSECFRGAADY